MSVPRLLVDVGNNANQVAKVTNATGETPAQTEDGFRAYRFSLMEAGRVLQSMGLATSYLGLASYASPPVL